MKCPDLSFEGERKPTTTNFSFFFLPLESGSKNPTAGEYLFMWLVRGHIYVALDKARALSSETQGQLVGWKGFSRAKVYCKNGRAPGQLLLPN